MRRLLRRGTRRRSRPLPFRLAPRAALGLGRRLSDDHSVGLRLPRRALEGRKDQGRRQRSDQQQILAFFHTIPPRRGRPSAIGRSHRGDGADRVAIALRGASNLERTAIARIHSFFETVGFTFISDPADRQNSFFFVASFSRRDPRVRSPLGFLHRRDAHRDREAPPLSRRRARRTRRVSSAARRRRRRARLAVPPPMRSR